MKIKKLFMLLAGALMALPGSGKQTAAPGSGAAASPAPEWMDSAVIYEANLRQGTPMRNLKGLQLQLPRLRDLGVDVIWLMPIHPISEEGRKGQLGSYYAVRDYKAVNPEFGTMQDLREFVRTAHAHGMKVILDEVCNHTGRDNAWVREHPEYYRRNDQGEMYGPYDWTDVYVLDYSNPATRKAMIDALKYWIEEADIDGYRCDVAGEVPTDFWEEARPELQSVKPVFMLAEASKPELLLSAFDADYAWPMKDTFNAIAASKGVNGYAAAKGQKLPEADAQSIPELIERQKKEYPAGSVHMNMITNHDLNSWEGTEFERLGPATGAFAVLSYTLPGMPMLYTGQETGFNHPFEFFGTDSIMPDYTPNEFTAFYESLNALKHRNKALGARQPAENTQFVKSADRDILTFTRTAAQTGVNGNSSADRVTVIANLSDKPATVKYNKKDVPDLRGMTNWFTGTDAELPAELAPWQYVVFTNTH